MSRRISLPIRSINGSLLMVDDEEADIQSILHHINTLPSTHVMARMLGSEIRTHVTAQTALDSIFKMRLNMFRYEDDDVISSISAEFEEDTAMRVIIKWKSRRSVGVIGGQLS